MRPRRRDAFTSHPFDRAHHRLAGMKQAWTFGYLLDAFLLSIVDA
jgi:hypothetical protein